MSLFNNRLFLIRHGQTELNKKHVIQGRVDSQLTDLGLKQAKEAARSAGDLKIDILISSDLGRAQETAEIIGKEIGLPLLKTTSALRERDFGSIDGKSFDEAAAIYPKYVNQKGVLNLYNEFPGAELIDDFYSRIVSGVKDLMDEYNNKNVMLVAHAGVLRMMYAYAHNIGPHKVWEIYDPNNCEVLNL